MTYFHHFFRTIHGVLTIIIKITTIIAIALHKEQGIKCLNRYWATVSKENRRLLNRSPLISHLCFVVYSFTPCLYTSLFFIVFFRKCERWFSRILEIQLDDDGNYRQVWKRKLICKFCLQRGRISMLLFIVFRGAQFSILIFFVFRGL